VAPNLFYLGEKRLLRRKPATYVLVVTAAEKRNMNFGGESLDLRYQALLVLLGQQL
jgi:hypothetical protein